MTPKSLAIELADRSDDELALLLAARPDLASPPPQGTGVLAQRALSAASITLAGESLDLLAVAVLDVVATADKPPTPAAVAKALTGRAEPADIAERITLLTERALLWTDGRRLVAPAHAPSAMPWQGRHITAPTATRTPQQWRAELDQLPQPQTALLTTLSQGPPLGRSRDAAPGSDPSLPVPTLLAAGMLARIDDQTVEIVPVVRQLLRHEPLLRLDDLRAPSLTPTGEESRFTLVDVDAAAGGEALELIRHSTLLLHLLGETPAAVLRSGAMGIRELRRLAKSTGLSLTRVGLIIELLGYLRFVDAGYPDPTPAVGADDFAWAPTHAADGWLRQSTERQWQALLATWLRMPRRAWLVGQPDRDGNALPALSTEVYDGQAAALRMTILTALSEALPGTSVSIDDLTAYLLWRHPRRLRQFTRALISENIREATELGLVAHNALSSVGRAALIAPPAESDAAISSAIDISLPKPVDHFLTQADLTLVVPGPMTHELADQVELVADLESGGAASVYRVTEASVRRALDAGRSGAELIAMFTTHSSTPVPQALSYLIEDVARRHGSLRVGIASAFVRCEDPATMAEVLRSNAAEALALRALAPTVAVSGASVRDVIDELRSAGFTPAGEDSSGALVDLRPQGSRIRDTRAPRQSDPRRPAPTPAQLKQIVSRIRSADRASATPRKASAPVRASGSGESAVALIQLALRTARQLRIDYVDAHGGASRHIVRPRLLGAGQLVAADVATDEEQHFSLHRVTSIELLDEK
ncbi:helicase-associated domain-containing protein [Gordonia sp. CPCC 205333]|uniref:helicase-associated domain-containing protein n=1 Tax=Gordonia sp. CPCC 205333 TaxID=3140790 RepID=UPI003AF3534A